MPDILLNEIYKILGQDSVSTFQDLIEERKAALGITNNLEFSKMVKIPNNTLARIIKGDNQKVDLFSVLKISEFLGLNLQEIIQIYVASLKSDSVGELESSRKANFIIRNFDLKGLKNAGFIKSHTDIHGVEERIVKFFGLDTIFDYSSDIGAVLFSRTKSLSQDKMREFWVRSAYYQFEKIDNPNEYDREKLLAVIPKIRPYTRFEEKGFLTVIKALFNIGITVIVQSYLTKTQVRGGTFIVKDKPCIVITDYNKTYPTLWFALLHELYHILFDLEELKTWKYHLTGEMDINLFKEDYADYFACETLFPQEKLTYISHMISSPHIVSEYAEKHKIHPGIIYAFYCYEEFKKGVDKYVMYQKFFGKSDKAINVVRTDPWQQETIFEEIEKIKERLISKTL